MSDDNRCACVCDDAEECFRRRYRISHEDYYDRLAGYERERCECVCHWPDEDDEEDWAL